MKFVIVIFIIDIIFITSLTSNEAWDLVVRDYSEGKVLNESKEFFIFQEENYTQLDINDNKMVELYEKQFEMLLLCGIRSYIFAINNRSQMNITDFRNNMRDNMKSWGINVNYSVFTVAMVDENDAFVYTGSKIRKDYIPDSIALDIKNTLLGNMERKEYYTAWKTFINDISNICYEKFIPNTTIPDPGPRPNRRSGTSINWESIVGGIVAVLALAGFIITCWKCRCCEKCNKIKSSSLHDYDTYSARNYGGNNDVSVGGYSTGGISVGGNSVGGNSVGGNSVGGHSIGGNNDNDGCSGGA